MTNPTPPSTRPKDLAAVPAHLPHHDPVEDAPDRGVIMTGENGADGHKAFYIHIEARPGKEDDVVRMLRDIYGCVLDEPGIGPWFAVRYSAQVFGIFEAFPTIAARDAHVAGGGGDIFRDNARMSEILARPAHVYRVDVLLNKSIIGE